MADDPKPFLLRRWWLPPALLAAGVAVAAWIYRDRPLTLDALPATVLASAAPLEALLGEPPARRVEYRMRRTTEVHGRRIDALVRHTADHLGGGWVRRHDDWYEPGAQFPAYQERLVLHRNLVQVHQRHRELAPFIHDLLADFGWLDNPTHAQTLTIAGRFPGDEGSTLAAAQSRTAPTDGRSLAPKPTPHERRFDCRREGSIDGALLGAGIDGALPRVRCTARRSHLDGSSTSEFAWLPQAGMFVLIASSQPAALGATEVVTQKLEALTITR